MAVRKTAVPIVLFLRKDCLRRIVDVPQYWWVSVAGRSTNAVEGAVAGLVHHTLVGHRSQRYRPCTRFGWELQEPFYDEGSRLKNNWCPPRSRRLHFQEMHHTLVGHRSQRYRPCIRFGLDQCCRSPSSRRIRLGLEPCCRSPSSQRIRLGL